MEQSIVFAHYKKDEHRNDILLGYRQDTFGSLGTNWAKIYTYSKEQVETVMKNINYTLGEKKESLGELLQSKGIPVIGINGVFLTDVIIEAEEKIYQQGQDAGAFEVRVLKCPDMIYEKYFDVKTAEWKTDIWGEYPREEMELWLREPESHEVIETHYFSKIGKINLQ